MTLLMQFNRNETELTSCEPDIRKMSSPVSGGLKLLNDRISQMKVTFEPLFLDNSQKFPAEFDTEKKIEYFPHLFLSKH